ncbi:MAG: cardiolipin synthase [Nocardioides sp.]|uniref:cardiolipin synthase n=1 Tax=Nocardioides sp. TaxID=35761 RepID=UPI0039E5D9E8
MSLWSADELISPVVAAAAFAVHLLTVVRAITRPNRTPASRVAWVAVIMCLPLVGVVAYALLGETSIGRGRVERLREAERRLARPLAPPAYLADPDARTIAALCTSINGFAPVAGNRVTLLGEASDDPAHPALDSDRAIDALIEAIEGAAEHVHISFYIWLDDHSGGRVANAVAAAARRGVVCRVMVDALGSRDFLRGPRRRELEEAGARVIAALEDIPRLGHLAVGRVDLRNHRKLVVVDNRIAFCGSQNCADPAFAPKARYGPWIDLLLRCEGPVVRQAQHLFLASWIAETGDDLDGLPAADPQPEVVEPGVTLQVFGTGPTTPGAAMSDAFVAAMYAAERELIVTTPYFVPDEGLLRALCAAPRRGVRTTLILPARCDSRLVAAASRSTYADLLACGVELHAYPLGLLHAKSVTVDGRLALVGSANMDRRSLELNFENNLLIHDEPTTAAIRRRQLGYLSEATPVTAADVAAWSFWTRLANNVVAMMSPVL